MADLAVVIPTRGRAAQCRGLIEAVRCTSKADVVVSVDADDPQIEDYRRIPAEHRDRVYLVITDGPGSHVAAINAGAAVALGLGVEVIAKFDDDHFPVTCDWDRVVLDAPPGIVYGNDLLQGENLPTAPFMAAAIVRALGYMGPPGLRHLYVDNFWRDIGQASGCLTYLPDLVIEHRHVLAGKAPMDEGYQRVNAPQRYVEDHEAYQRYLATDFTADVEKLRACLSPS